MVCDKRAQLPLSNGETSVVSGHVILGSYVTYVLHTARINIFPCNSMP